MNVAEKAALKDKVKENYVPVVTRKEAAKVRTREILYIETELRMIVIHTASRPHRCYGKLDDVLRYLDDNFYRCHKSCIINFEKVLRMSEGVFYFTDGVTLRVGQNNYRLAKNQYVKYLKQNAQIWQGGGDS